MTNITQPNSAQPNSNEPNSASIATLARQPLIRQALIRSGLVASVVLALGGCSYAPEKTAAAPVTPPAAAPAVAPDANVAAARKAAGQLGGKLREELQAAMMAGGPASAIGVCKERAPALAAEASAASGMTVTRISPKNRNPAGVPDAWEAAAYDALATRAAAGEKPDTLEVWGVVETPTGKTFRYARAVPTQPVCLTCHGDAATLPDAVKARLAADYPHDRATGFTPGSLRGLVSVQKPL
jgi:hypothetical protein